MSGQLTSRTAVGVGGGALTIDPAIGIWVVEPLQYALAQVDPSNGQIERTIPLHHTVGGVSAGHGRVWVALGSP